MQFVVSVRVCVIEVAGYEDIHESSKGQMLDFIPMGLVGGAELPAREEMKLTLKVWKRFWSSSQQRLLCLLSYLRRLCASQQGRLRRVRW